MRVNANKMLLIVKTKDIIRGDYEKEEAKGDGRTKAGRAAME